MTERPLLDGLEPPNPPPGLREAALAAGRRGMRSAPSRDPWRRIWQSPAARLAWGAAVLLLVFAHARVSRERRVDVATARAVEPELKDVAQLSRLAENSPPQSARFPFEGGPL